MGVGEGRAVGGWRSEMGKRGIFIRGSCFRHILSLLWDYLRTWDDVMCFFDRLTTYLAWGWILDVAVCLLAFLSLPPLTCRFPLGSLSLLACLLGCSHAALRVLL